MTIRNMGGKCKIIDQGEGEAFLIVDGTVLVAEADTLKEAEQAKRAFELVLAPRFTRDEAIAIVRANLPQPADARSWSADYLDGFGRGVALGMRAALEALAAAGVFSDAPGTPGQPKDVGRMADLLDAAGIR